LSILTRLVQNEMLKLWNKKRFFVILFILIALIPIFSYAELKIAQNNAAKFADWRQEVLQQITDLQNTLSSDRIPEEWKRNKRIAVQQLQYYLDHDINPSVPNGVTFTRTFLDNSASLFLPLLILSLGSDIVSGERTQGTMKSLLARPVRRWKLLTSKLIALLLYVSLTIMATVILCYSISGLFFGYEGWQMPVVTGFKLSGAEIDTSGAHSVPQWLFITMQAGLVWYSSLCVALLAFMVSVLVRSTAASIVTMMSVIVAGTILSNMSSSWSGVKYLFSVNLKLTDYLQGSSPPIDGMTFPFSLILLAVWGLAALAISFGTFTKQDILH